MAYYIVYDTKGNYMGYSQEKEWAYGLQKQRKKFQKLNIEKFKDNEFNDKAKHSLYMSSGDIFIYHGAYLFEHEQDVIHTQCLDYYKKVYETLVAYHSSINLLKFKDSEKEALAKFTKELFHMEESILDEYYSSEDPYYDCFKTEEIALGYIKKMYKEIQS